MSTISQTPAIKATHTRDFQHVSLLVTITLVLLAVLAVIVSTVSPAAQPFDGNAYMLYRQGEWISASIPMPHAEAYQIYRQGEVASPVSDAEAFRIFRQGEVTSVPVLTNAEAYQIFRLGELESVIVPDASFVDLTAYHLSERASVVNSLTDYFASERTMIPVKNNFTAYQLSEWFGK